jgi:iron-sulfur cluster repair protein YtfE (RIC family)
MKRAPELRDLSDHHYQGLVQARRLRRAATGEEAPPLEETSEAFLEFWQEGTTAHFREEEEVLLPVLTRYGGEVGGEPVAEMLAQHAQIRGLVMELSDELRNKALMPETLQRIGELLEAHIRLEEREVFPKIEEVLAEEGLKEVADRLKVREARPQAEPWIPKEGLSYEPWPGPGDSEGGGYDWPVSPV